MHVSRNNRQSLLCLQDPDGASIHVWQKESWKKHSHASQTVKLPPRMLKQTWLWHDFTLYQQMMCAWRWETEGSASRDKSTATRRLFHLLYQLLLLLHPLSHERKREAAVGDNNESISELDSQLIPVSLDQFWNMGSWILFSEVSIRSVQNHLMPGNLPPVCKSDDTRSLSLVWIAFQTGFWNNSWPQTSRDKRIRLVWRKEWYRWEELVEGNVLFLHHITHR